MKRRILAMWMFVVVVFGTNIVSAAPMAGIDKSSLIAGDSITVTWSGFMTNVDISRVCGTTKVLLTSNQSSSGSKVYNTSGWPISVYCQFWVKSVSTVSLAETSTFMLQPAANPVVSVDKVKVEIGQNLSISCSGFNSNVSLQVEQGGSFWKTFFSNTSCSSANNILILKSDGWKQETNYRIKAVSTTNSSIIAYSGDFKVEFPDAIPTINFTSPVSNGGNYTTSSSSVTITGVSNDDVRLLLTQINVNNQGWQDTVNVSNWNQSITLTPGVNTISAKTEDSKLQWSQTASITITYNKPDTYSWNVGPWGACTNVCGVGVRNRTVQCQNQNGSVVSDGYCSAKPTTQEACNGTSGCKQPIANIISISPTVALSGQEVVFSGSGSDPDGGSITKYQWASSIDGLIGSTSSFSKTNLTIGNHTITFSVTDDENAVSIAVSGAVTINKPNTYSWNIGPWSACTNVCGIGVRNRTVQCQNQDGVIVSDSYCLAKPITQESCNNSSGCPPPNKAPTVSINSHNSGDVLSVAEVTFFGSAYDEDGTIIKVLVNLNSNGWQTAQGFTIWSQKTYLNQGSNIILSFKS